jgi:hypothetical protein
LKQIATKLCPDGCGITISAAKPWCRSCGTKRRSYAAQVFFAKRRRGARISACRTTLEQMKGLPPDDAALAG